MHSDFTVSAQRSEYVGSLKSVRKQSTLASPVSLGGGAARSPTTDELLGAVAYTRYSDQTSNVDTSLRSPVRPRYTPLGGAQTFRYCWRHKNNITPVKLAEKLNRAPELLPEWIKEQISDVQSVVSS